MNRSERDAIAACQRGELSAFDALYDAYLNELFGYIFRRTLDRALTEDITSTVFLKALEKIGTYNEKKASFRTWLYAIARNAVTDAFRAKRITGDIADAWDIPDDAQDATAMADMEAVRTALRALDPRKREIVLLRLWEGLPYREIASLLHLTENNCKVQFSRALQQLRSECTPATLALLFLFPLFP